MAVGAMSSPSLPRSADLGHSGRPPGGQLVARPWAPRGPVQYRPWAISAVCTRTAPDSYTGVTGSARLRRRPGHRVSTTAGGGKPFQAEFAAIAAGTGAMTLVQMDPTDVSPRRDSAGRTTPTCALTPPAVKAFGSRVILSFGHEMNGYWYSWGNLSTRRPCSSAAWRHVVHVFRQQGTRNVTWLWAVNVINRHVEIPNPAPWWPGDSYVNWVGIDGY